MKKIVALVLVLAMGLSMVACKAQAPTESTEPAATEAASTGADP